MPRFCSQNFRLVLIVSFSLVCAPAILFAQSYDSFPRLTVRDGKIFAGNEELFLNAIAYSGIRPGKDQYDSIKDDRYGYDLVDLDMQRIKEAGFNAIRTYALLDEKIVELAAKHGLWVIPGIWTDQSFNLDDPAQAKKQMDIVARQAKIYAQYPNVAILFLINEPNPAVMSSPMAKKYLARLAETAKQNCPHTLISFANMPNAVFIDRVPWDVISFNIYAHVNARFQKSLGYRGYVEGVRKLAAGDKPFFISEYGFYATLPNPHPEEPWLSFFVESEAKQAENLLRDQSDLAALPLSGVTLMLFSDDWRNFGEMPEAHRFLKSVRDNKRYHDAFTQEWGGLFSFDKDRKKGTPRPAYFALADANQALVLSPDPETVYPTEVPVRLYVTDQVKDCEIFVDGKKAGEAIRVSPHWMEFRIPSFAGAGSPVRHWLTINVIRAHGAAVRLPGHVFWTGEEIALPTLSIEKKGKSFKPEFRIRLTTADGQPIQKAKVQWGLFDVFNWQDYGGEIETDAAGEAVVQASKYATYLVGAGYEFKTGEYTKRITGFIFSR